MYQTYFIEAPIPNEINIIGLVLKLIEVLIMLPIHNFKILA